MKQEEVWNGIAEYWDEFRTTIEPEIKEFLKDKKGKILDMGCGNGRNFYNKKGIEYYGVDFSEKALLYAKKRAKEKGIIVNLQKAKVNELPYKKEFFDYIIYNRVIHCIPNERDRKKSLTELHRVLKKGGEAIITSWGKDCFKIKGRTGNIEIPWKTEKKELIRKQYIYTQKELQQEIKETGFEILNTKEENNITITVKKT